MAIFHFLRPEWLWGFLPLTGLLIVLTKHKATAQLWESVCDAHLLPHVLMGTPGKQSSSPVILLGLGWTLALVALAGPVWSKLPQPVFRAKSALVIILDVSRSMDAQDIAPSRLTRAKHKILDILQTRKEGQTALVVFAGDAFVVSPLTDDARTMKTLVQTLETNLMPVQGSRPDLALTIGHDLLVQAGIPGGNLLLITDGKVDSAAIHILKQVAQKDRTISILGVGTEDGAPIPDQGGFVKDETGTIVVPKLDPDSLHEVARTVGGRYATVTLNDQDLDHVVPTTNVSTLSTSTKEDQRTTNIWREEGPWLTGILLLVTLPAFRRGWIGALLIFVFLPQVSQAFSWENIWERPDQRAMKALEQHDPQKAAALFEQPDWKGIAHYHAGEYDQAEQVFSGMDSPDGHYNRGNALAKLGKYQEAIASYQTALKQQPDHADAQHNLDLLKKMLENQQSPNSQENNSEPSDSSSDNQQQHDEGERSGQQSQEGESEKSEQENKQEQASSQNDTSQDEAGASESRQDSSGDSNKAEESQAQSPAKDMEENRAQSDIAQPNQGENKEKTTSQEQMASASESDETREDQKSQQALQQWLRRIPDDPGGLLRRKFLLEHQRRVEAGTAVDSTGRAW